MVSDEIAPRLVEFARRRDGHTVRTVREFVVHVDRALAGIRSLAATLSEEVA